MIFCDRRLTKDYPISYSHCMLEFFKVENGLEKYPGTSENKVL